MLASHLKPLEKKDKMGQKRNVLWNPCAAHARAPQTCDVEIPQVRDASQDFVSLGPNLTSGKGLQQLLPEESKTHCTALDQRSRHSL